MYYTYIRNKKRLCKTNMSISTNLCEYVSEYDVATQQRRKKSSVKES